MTAPTAVVPHDAGPAGPAVPSVPGHEPGTPPDPAAGSPSYARWSRRVVAALLDAAVLGGATWLVLGAGASAPVLQPTTTPRPPGGLPTDVVSWVSSPWIVALVVALLALQGWTGQTPGKRVVGIAVVREGTLRAPGFWRSALRVPAHLVDAILLIGYLRPLWHPERRTVADSWVGTVVVRTGTAPLHPWSARDGRPSHGAPRPRSTVVSVAALLVCGLGVGFSLSSWGSGGERRLATASCDVVAEPGSTLLASAVVHVEERWGSERRLWVVRPTEPTRERRVLAWSWTRSSGGDADVEVTTTLRDADGQVVWDGRAVVHADGSSESWSDVDVAGRIDGADVTLPVGLAGPGWTVASTVRADGAGAATCTLPGSALRPVDG